MEKTNKDFFKDIDEYEKQFYCNECGEHQYFNYDRTVSNGEIWNCGNCETELIVNEKPNEDDY
jgi:transcription elongation factor Elf1